MSVVPASRERMAGRTSSVTSCPLRWRVTTSDWAASAEAASSGSRPASAPVTSMSQSQEVTSSCSEPARSSRVTAPCTSMPAGRAGDRRAARVLTSSGVPAASSRSRYSASDSWPVERASPKLTLGRGENPWV